MNKPPGNNPSEIMPGSKTRENHRLILGLDPGSVHTGYGLIEVQGSKLKLVSQGHVSPPPDWTMPRRLAHIHRAILNIIECTRPTAAAVEDVFTFKNPRSALKLAQARGVVILAAALAELPIFEYPPGLVKKAITGQGQADKNQVAFMVGRILNLEADLKLTLDASDALAVAICHAGQSLLPDSILADTARRNRASSWRNLTPENLVSLGYKVEKDRK